MKRTYNHRKLLTVYYGYTLKSVDLFHLMKMLIIITVYPNAGIIKYEYNYSIFMFCVENLHNLVSHKQHHMLNIHHSHSLHSIIVTFRPSSGFSVYFMPLLILYNHLILICNFEWGTSASTLCL